MRSANNYCKINHPKGVYFAIMTVLSFLLNGYLANKCKKKGHVVLI